MNLPNLFLIGAPKAGTTALADQLQSHPMVFCDVKEPRFFDASVFYDVSSDATLLRLDDYLSLFDSPEAESSKYRLDASVFTMYDASAIQKILHLSPDSRFIICIRDPITACRSMHSQRMKYADRAMREISDSFAECWAIVPERRHGRGFPPGCRNRKLFRYDFLYHYEWHLPQIMELVRPSRILILFHEDMKANPSAQIKKIARFLDLDAADFSDFRALNSSYTIDRSLQNILREHFVLSAARLTRKLRKKFPALQRFAQRAGTFAGPKKKQFDASTEKFDEVLESHMREEFRETYRYLGMLRPNQSDEVGIDVKGAT